MIVIPMAGMSARFQRAGYQVPKYMLQAYGRSLFAHAIESFHSYFDEEPFLFIYRDVQDTAQFVQSECTSLGIRQFHLAALEAPTRGQAETVSLGLKQASVSAETPLSVFNIDTFRPNFRYPEFLREAKVSGYLEVFRGSGANWSFARTDSPNSNRVVETSEKRPISDLCCTGFYYFRRTDDFNSAYREASAQPIETLDAQELYVAPLYNRLIRDGKDIRVDIIDRSQVIFCGVPIEYEQFLQSSGA